MYRQNLGVRPDAPGEPIFTKFCMRVIETNLATKQCIADALFLSGS